MQLQYIYFIKLQIFAHSQRVYNIIQRYEQSVKQQKKF